MASLQNIGINVERNKADTERTSHPMSKEQPLNRSQNRDSYWFAYGRQEDASPGNAHSDTKVTAEQKEEKLRLFREHQEQERVRKLHGLEQQLLSARRLRERQEEERRRRLEEARCREAERRQQVEERKRQIWEAEQERKEAILRRNMEREARIEARRNAQRNSQSFAFGSSTPRSFDLDLALGRNPLLMASAPRRHDEPPRATSACSLDRKFESLDPNSSYKQIAFQQKSSSAMKACLSMLEDTFDFPPPVWLVGSGVLVGEDCMSRSMVSLSSSTFRGRRRTDITPTMGRERSATPHTTPRGNPSRAVSMTRLDQLAQPRRTDLGRSMINLAPPPSAGRRGPRGTTPSMSRSMLHLPGTPRRPSPDAPPSSGMRAAQSMAHLAPPRLTRAARLRAEALSRATSAWSLSPGKDSSRSPTRPQSAMSGTSEVSATSSSVSLRPRPAPRRPRPFSVAGSAQIDRQPRTHDRSSIAPRAHSVSREGDDPKGRGPRKPLPPPKPSELLTRAKPHPVPTKDNMRKITKSANKPTEEKDNSISDHTSTDKIVCKRKEQQEEVQLNSAVTSPTTDSDMLSSEDSKMAVSDEVSQPVSSEATKAVTTNQNIPVPEEVEPAGGSSPVGVATQEAETPKSVIGENLIDVDVTTREKAEIAEIPAPVTQAKAETVPTAVKEKGDLADSFAPSKPRISSEEEARAALAEKRRLAREQAEKEAELERQRLELIRRAEEEERAREEEEQLRQEQEQLRLQELHRQMEQEKLQRAIEEQQLREREEKERREEEARQRAEKEDQEKKAREEAERQRVELEEKLRKEEEERAERKRRVEQIMARTRGKAAAHSPSSNPSEAKPAHIPNGTNHRHSEAWPEQRPLPDVLGSAPLNGGLPGSASNGTNEDLSPQSNGYSSHEDMSCTTSPEESTDLLIDLQSHLGNVNNDNFLIQVDDLNSNPFSDTLQKKQDSQVTDLLS